MNNSQVEQTNTQRPEKERKASLNFTKDIWSVLHQNLTPNRLAKHTWTQGFPKETQDPDQQKKKKEPYQAVHSTTEAAGDVQIHRNEQTQKAFLGTKSTDQAAGV